MIRDRGREAHSRKKTVLACLAAMLTLPSGIAACGNSAAPTPRVSARDNPLGDLTISQGDHREVALTVEIADNEAAWQKGLMGVRNLPADRGMAFVFHRQVGFGFWMKDTLIPLDIAFADAQERIVDVQHMVPCVADPCHTYLAAQPYSVAVEARSGVLAAAGVRDGDVMVLKRRT